MKTVASISFRDDKSLSLDILDVQSIRMGRPIQVDEETWFSELIVDTQQGKVSMQLLAKDPEKFDIEIPQSGDSLEDV
ncbi:MAG: hypothetical protein ACPGOY_08320 [Rhodospirillaceae bacterium]